MHGLREFLPLRFFRLVLEPDISLQRVFNLSIFRSICTTKCSLRAWATTTMSSGTSPARKCLIFTVGRLCWLDRLSRCISPDGRWLEHLHSSERMPRLSTYPLSVDVGYRDEFTIFTVLTISSIRDAGHQDQRKASMYISTRSQDSKGVRGSFDRGRYDHSSFHVNLASNGKGKTSQSKILGANCPPHALFLTRPSPPSASRVFFQP